MSWISKSLLRTDDAYHAWAYEVAENADQPHDGLCPVVVQIAQDGSDKAALMENLKWVQDQANNAESDLFHMTSHDVAHLVTVIARHAEKDDAPQLFDYERIFLVCIREDRLFPEASLGQAFDRHLTVLYAGRPTGMDDVALVGRSDKFVSSAKTACLAIIDDSIAFLNKAFTQNGNSLFSHLWFQKNLDIAASTSGVVTGVQIQGTGIDDLRAASHGMREMKIYESDIGAYTGIPFRAIDRSSKSHQPLAFPVSHGTHVTDTALKSYGENAGALENLALFGVTLPVEVTQNTSGSTLGSYVLSALRQVMLWADDLGRSQGSNPPLVINFSYGFTAGPKDGSDNLNRIISLMIDSRNAAGRETALVVPMGNSFLERGSGEVTLTKGECRDLQWVLPEKDGTPSFLEVVSLAQNGLGDFDLTITPSGGLPVQTTSIDGSLVAAGQTNVMLDSGNLVAMCSEWPRNDLSEYKRRAVIAVAPTVSKTRGVAPSGAWDIQLKNTSQHEITLQISVQRDDAPGTYPAIGRQSYLRADDSLIRPDKSDGLDSILFPQNATLTHRLTSSVLASNQSQYVVAVGAGTCASGHQEQPPAMPSPYASAGPRNSSQFGPDISALADRSLNFPGIYRAGTYSGTVKLLSGSSVAAPQYAGRLAANPNSIGMRRPSTPEELSSDLKALRFHI